MHGSIRLRSIAALVVTTACASQGLAQSVLLRVVSTDSTPIPFAWVSVRGGLALITDDAGRVSLGQAKRQHLNVEVRRIGYLPWFGKVEIPDTAATLTVVLARTAQQLSKITVTGERLKSRLELAGFYDRWQMRQKGALSATFIGPEEIEKRHPSRGSDLLYGINGVSLMRTPRGGVVAKGNGGTCFMAVLLDGRPLCPRAGCHTTPATAQNAPQMTAPPHDASAGAETLDDIAVDLDQYVDVNDLAAIEVYARGGNMPVSLQANDSACGVIALWTGSRQP